MSGSIKVRVKYKIEDSPNNSIRHGWVKMKDLKVKRSFLRFGKKKEAQNVHKNLSKLQGMSFLKSYFIIEHQEDYWLAVDKIQYSLKEYKRKHREIWNDSGLVSEYQDIIRGIIIGICELHRQGHTLGSLSINDILVVKDKPKFAFIRKTYGLRSEGYYDFKYLKDLFKKILGTGDELKHFYDSIEVNHMSSLSKLYFHPILMAPMERFFQPVKMDTLARYPDYKNKKRPRALLRNNWIEKVDMCYEPIKNYAYTTYRQNVWNLFKFVRNAIVHINEYAEKKEGDVVRDLSGMFPDSFNEIYDLFDHAEMALGSRECHLEPPTKDREKKRTRQQSPRRSPKRIRRDHQLNSRSKPSPPTQMPRPLPSSSHRRQSSLRKSPARQHDRYQTGKGR
ncbi:unnamed protein product [Camellia sinensis]